MHYILVVLSLFLRNRGLWRPASVFSMWCDVMWYDRWGALQTVTPTLCVQLHKAIEFVLFLGSSFYLPVILVLWSIRSSGHRSAVGNLTKAGLLHKLAFSVKGSTVSINAALWSDFFLKSVNQACPAETSVLAVVVAMLPMLADTRVQIFKTSKDDLSMKLWK